MAKINDGTMKNWIDGDKFHASDYKQDRDILRAAINDNDGNVHSLQVGQTGIEQRVSATETKTVQHETKIATAETRLGGLEVNDGTQNNKIGDLESSVYGILAPTTFNALTQRNMTFDDVGIGYVDKQLNPVRSQLTSVTTSLAEIAYNPKTNGAKFDGTNDDSVAIQTTIDQIASNGGGEVLLSGIIGLSNKITVKEGVTLNSYNATIKALTNTDLVEFKRNTQLKGNLYVTVEGVNYTKSAVVLDGANKLNYRDIIVDNLFLQGNNASGGGNAIHFRCVTANSSISFVEFNKIVVRGFEKAIFLESSGSASYINANIFNSLKIGDCDYHIYSTGDRKTSNNQADGNQFNNVQLQAAIRTKEIVHIDGWGNIVNGIVFDANKDSMNLKILNLTKESANNVVSFSNVTDSLKYSNLGNNNKVMFGDNEQGYIPHKQGLTYTPNNSKNYFGDYEDILHRADVVNKVNVVAGAENVKSGLLSNIFNGNIYGNLTLDLSGDKEYSWEIDFTNGNYTGISSKYLYGGINILGFYFSFNRSPKTIKIDITDIDNQTTSTQINAEELLFLPVIKIGSNSINKFGSHLTKIKITFIGQTSTDVRLGRMFANSINIGGVKYLSNSGGVVAGRLVFTNNQDGIVLTSSNGTRFFLRVENDGTLKLI